MPRIVFGTDDATDDATDDGRSRAISIDSGTFTIGVAPDRDIVVPESRFVAAEHASIHSEGESWLVRDGGSAHGTYVNDRRVKEQRLRDDDVLELGLGGPMLRFEGEPETGEVRERSSAITAGRRKPFFGRPADGSPSDTRDGAARRTFPTGARGVLYAIGGLALLAIGALWMAGRDGDMGSNGGRLAAASSPVAPGGVLHPLREASRAYTDDHDRLASEAESRREGGLRRARLQETLAGIAVGIERGVDDPAALDSLQAERVSVEGSLSAMRRLREIGRDVAGSIVLIQTGFQVDSFYFPGPTGTGFFAGEAGRLVASRHIVAPDSYIRSSEEAGVACALRDLEESGRTAIRIVSVWTAGVRPEPGLGGGLDPATATHSTADGTVEVLDPPGVEGSETRTIECPGGGVVGSGHDPDRPADLALLSIPGGDFPTLTLADAVPAPGDMVVLTGFPRGTVGAYGGAAPWMTFGAVTSSEEPIRLDVPVLPGSDGGPVLDGEGRLVGVATGSRGDEGTAVGASRVRALLDGI